MSACASRCCWPDPTTAKNVGRCRGIANHMNLGSQASPAALLRMVYRLLCHPFSPAPEEIRVARTTVESII